MKQFDKSEVIGGLLVLFVGVLIGAFWLSDVASPAIGLFTSIGSIATALTLVFLVIQNKKQEKHQLDMWKEQREMLVFQKLQMHKSLFNDLLNELEDNLNVTFFDRTGFYKKIFPDNGFNNFSAVVLNIKGDIKADSLPDCISMHQRLIKSLEDYEAMKSNTFVNQHLTDLLRFGSMLHVTLPNEHKFGDITCTIGSNTFCLTNIFELNKTISIYEKVLARICDFSELEHVSSRKNWDGSHYHQALFDFVFLQLNHREFNVNLGQVQSVISDIYKRFIKNGENYLCEDNVVSSVLFYVHILFAEGFKNTDEEQAIIKLLPLLKELYQALEDQYQHPTILMSDKQNHILRTTKFSIDCLSKRLNQLQKRITF